MLHIFLLFFVLFLFIYMYYSVLLVFLLLEFFTVLNFFFINFSACASGLSLVFIVVFSCFMVMEAVLMLSFLMGSYRFFGKNYYFLW